MIIIWRQQNHVVRFETIVYDEIAVIYEGYFIYLPGEEEMYVKGTWPMIHYLCCGGGKIMDKWFL